MKIAIPKERLPGETRVAATPEIVKKIIGIGLDVVVEKDAGAIASCPDAAYKEAGATIAKDAETALKDAVIVFKVQRPITEGDKSELPLMKKGAVVIATMYAALNKKDMEAIAQAGLTSFSMELMPRISRAQSMDVLSSQSNLAGYKSVLDAAAEFGSAFPMMMTAAGTIAPAKVFIMGAGVAGLQAIATAKRLGAVVTAYDVRPTVKEQVESLGGKFVEVDEEATKEAETSGGYAKEMGDDFKKRQAEVTHEHLKKQDIVICTALIPGKPAPVLITEEMVKDMKPGSVIVDLAVEMGGNCPLSKLGKVVVKHGVKIVGHDNVPGRLPKDASALYGRNLLNFIAPHVDKESKMLNFDWEDETVKGTLVTRDGQVVNPAVTGEGD